MGIVAPVAVVVVRLPLVALEVLADLSVAFVVLLVVALAVVALVVSAFCGYLRRHPQVASSLLLLPYLSVSI